MSDQCNNSSRPSVPQRSEEGDARRELLQLAMRVFRKEQDELMIRLRRSSSGHIYVDSYEPS